MQIFCVELFSSDKFSCQIIFEQTTPYRIMLSIVHIFRVLNFHTKLTVQKYFNNLNFPIYGTVQKAKYPSTVTVSRFRLISYPDIPRIYLPIMC